MAVEWFCKISGKKFGPLSSKQLRAMVQKGQLLPQHEVTQGTGGPWVPAGRVKGLFSQGGAPAEDPESEEVPVAELIRKPAKKPAVKAAVKEKPARRRIPSASLPVAEAAPQPPAAPAVRRPKAAPSPATRPVAQPVMDQPAGENPLGIVTDDYTPIARATGRGRASTVIPEGKKKQNLTLVIALVMVIVALAAAGIYLMVRDKNPDKPAKESEQTAEDSSQNNNNGTEPKPPGNSSTPPAEPDESEKWYDASTESITCGDVQVKILSAKVGIPMFIGRSGNPGLPKNPKPYLQIQIQLKNTHPTKKLEYTSWSAGRTEVKPEDDFGNTYKRGRFVGGAPLGQLTTESIYPNKTIQDLLVFEPPIDTIEYLRLELPASAFGEKGTLRFEIPKEWIGVAADAPDFPGTEPSVEPSVEPPTEPADVPSPSPDEIPIAPPDPGPEDKPPGGKRKPADDFPDLFENEPQEQPQEREKPDPFDAFEE